MRLLALQLLGLLLLSKGANSQGIIYTRRNAGTGFAQNGPQVVTRNYAFRGSRPTNETDFERLQRLLREQQINQGFDGQLTPQQLVFLQNLLTQSQQGLILLSLTQQNLIQRLLNTQRGLVQLRGQNLQVLFGQLVQGLNSSALRIQGQTLLAQAQQGFAGQLQSDATQERAQRFQQFFGRIEAVRQRNYQLRLQRSRRVVILQL